MSDAAHQPIRWRAKLLAMIGLAVLLLIQLGTFRWVIIADARENQVRRVQLSIERIMYNLAAAEAAQRRFIMSGALDAQTSWHAAAEAARREVTSLITIAADEERRPSAEQLQQLVQQKLRLLQAGTADPTLLEESVQVMAAAHALAADMQEREDAVQRAGAASFPWREAAHSSICIASAVGLSMALMITLRREQRSACRLGVAVAEKITLLREINHRVGNSLQMVVTMIQLQALRFRDEKVVGAFQATRNRVLAVGEIHKRLQSAETINTLDMADYLKSLCGNLERQLLGERGTVQVRVEPIQLPVEIAVPVGLAVNELVSNAVQHGYAADERAVIEVELVRADNLHRLRVRDQGRGLPETFDTSPNSGVGMILLTALASQLGGELTLRSECGTEVCLAFEVRNG